MAKFYSNETRQTGDFPARPSGDEALGGRIRLYRATIPLDAPKLSSSTAGTVIATTDTVSLFRIPAGYRFVAGRITSTVSLGTSTVAIGNATTAGKYRAAAVFTTANAPTAFGLGDALAAAASTAEEEVILTVATADLPTTAGAKLVIDIEVVGP